MQAPGSRAESGKSESLWQNLESTNEKAVLWYVYSLAFSTNISSVFPKWGSKRNVVLYLRKVMMREGEQAITHKLPKVAVKAT